jgi:hypothetical protein
MADILITCDVDLEPITPDPRYRVWVDQELFAERRWIWSDQYLEENIWFRAGPGRYTLRVELVGADQAWLQVKNYQIRSGPARINQAGQMEILDETA